MPDWTEELDVFCADTGSLKLGNFAWARRIPAAGVEVHPHEDIGALADAVAILGGNAGTLVSAEHRGLRYWPSLFQQSG